MIGSFTSLSANARVEERILQVTIHNKHYRAKIMKTNFTSARAFLVPYLVARSRIAVPP